MTELHLSVIFVAARIVRSCQSTLVRAMLIGAVIVRDHVRATPVRATSVQATVSELEYSETMTKRTFIAGIIWDHGRATLVTAPELSETMSERTFIAGIIRDYVRPTLGKATWIRLGLSDHIRATLVTLKWQWIPGSVTLSIWGQSYRLCQEGSILRLYNSHQVILSTCTMSLFDEYVLSVCLLHPNMLSTLNRHVRPCSFEIAFAEFWELLAGLVEEYFSFVYRFC